MRAAAHDMRGRGGRESLSDASLNKSYAMGRSIVDGACLLCLGGGNKNATVEKRMTFKRQILQKRCQELCSCTNEHFKKSKHAKININIALCYFQLAKTIL